MEARNVAKSSSYLKAEKAIHGKLSRFFLTENPHHLIPGYNLHREREASFYDAETARALCTDFPYNCDFPKPLLPPAPISRLVLSGEDSALQLVITKARIQQDIDRILEYFKRNKNAAKIPMKKDLKWTRGNKSCSNVPKYVAEVAELVEADPDPYFDGTYNWYYTGGTLKHLILGDLNILLFPFTSELVATPVVPRKESIWKPKLKNASKCSLDGNLYDLKHSTLNNTCYIMGRYKNHCVFYRLLGTKEKLDLLEIHKQTSNIPYMSADIHPRNPNLFCTADAERTVAIWDSTRLKPVTSKVIPHTSVLNDNWTSIKYQQFDNNVLVYADRCCVRYLDTRMPIDTPALTQCPKDNLEACENICLLFGSRNEYCHYVGAYHHLLLLDKRSKVGVQQKWTHMFKSAPLKADVIQRDERDVIVLTSQLSGESTVILNTWTSQDHAESSSMPYKPPSILETLSMSQSMGKCLDPMLKTRLKLCNTGSTLVPNEDGNISHFFQNSIGDVFYQCITHQDSLNPNSVENCKAYCALESWEQAMLAQQTTKQTIKPLWFTDKADMQHIFRQCSNTTLKVEHGKHEKNEIWGIPRWKQSLDKLNSYVDVLAPELLAMWEISEDPAEVPLSAAPHQKVMNWLERSEVGPGIEPSQSSSFNLDEMPLTPINTQEMVSVSQQQNIPNSQDSDILQQYLPKVTTRTKQNRNKRKRPQYVAGF